MGAIVALPVAAMVTAFIKEYAHNYPVVYQSAYADPVPASTDAEAPNPTAGIADQSPA
jgi:hypothetical protein